MRHDECFIRELEQVSSSEEFLLKKLSELATSAMERLGSDSCALLLLDASRQTLTLWTSQGLATTAPRGARITEGHGVFWKVIKDKRAMAFPDLGSDPDHFHVPELENERFNSMLCAPLVDGDDCIGALCVQDEGKREYAPEEIRELERVAGSLTCSVKASWFFTVVQESARVFSKLNEMSASVNTTSDLDKMLDCIVRSSVDLTNARGGVVWLTDGGDVVVKRFSGVEGDHPPGDPPECVIAQAALSHQVVKIDSVKSDETFSEDLSRVARRSLMCQPMIFEGQVLGFILVTDRLTSSRGVYAPFSGEDAKNLSSIAQTASQAIARVKTTHQLEEALNENRKNVRELSILFQLSMAMQRAISLDDLLRVILSCVTVGKGLGFNRAILFLVNENTGMLQGMMGLGPDSGEEAGRIWSRVNGQAEDSNDFVQWLLDRDPREIAGSAFNHFARSIRTTLSGESVLARAVREKKAINVKAPEDLGEADHELASGLGCDRFAIVPLVVMDTAMGAILVDNMYNRRPITGSDIELLTRFAGPAAWAIENIKLFERLSAANRELINLESQMARVEKMSALGEISAEVAHELKNPLVTIGGFARRLLARTPGSKPEARYTSIIVKEVERLESMLRDTLDVAKEVRTNRASVDLNRIVRDVVDFYWSAFSEKGIEVDLSLSQDLPKISVDAAQIKQVVINLVLNAIEAMACGRHEIPRRLIIKTRIVEGSPNQYALEISDTGGGMAERDLAMAFNPFFTSKPNGTGLGLSLCKKIIRMHHGTMEIDNRLGIGVTFTIILPNETVFDKQDG